VTMISTSTLKPRTLNGSTGAVDDRAALALDALGTVATEPAPTPDPAPQRKRKARAATPATDHVSPPAAVPEPSDLEVLGQVALAAHAEGVTLEAYVARLTRQLEAVRRVLGGTSR
jgi:hypothetical protein